MTARKDGKCRAKYGSTRKNGKVISNLRSPLKAAIERTTTGNTCGVRPTLGAQTRAV